jgi:hypothetical protein
MGIDAGVISFPDPQLAVEASVVLWGCSVAYHVTIQGKTFRRDVTEFRRSQPLPVTDGPWRTSTN